MSQTIVLSHTTPDFEFCVDYVPLGGEDRFYLAHVDVFRWTPRVLREMHAIWPALRQRIDAPLFAWNKDEDAKWEKFITRFGFRYFKNLIGPDGKEHKFFLHI
jgi:hypothetical protein